MIEEKNITQQYHRIRNLLEQNRLKESQLELSSFIGNSNNWQRKSQLEQDMMAYDFMLKYFIQGSTDPERAEMLNKLLLNAWGYATQTYLSYLDECSTNSYHTLYKGNYIKSKGYQLNELFKEAEQYFADLELCREMPDPQQELKRICQNHKELMKYIFMSTWINRGWTDQEEMQAKTALATDQLLSMDLALFVNAVMLSLLECFDARKFSFLLDAYAHHDNIISQRALVNMVIIMMIHPQQISLNKELSVRISLYYEDENFAKDINRIYLQLLTAQDADAVDKKMRDEIIPEMMKNSHLMKKMRWSNDDINLDETGYNPEWEKELENSSINDKIKEMSELQMQGADLYMGTFSHLKNYPFFFNIQNWFYPFDALHPDILMEYGFPKNGKKSTLEFLLDSGMFCSSDKYSLSFMMAMIPSSQREMMLNQMTSQDLTEFLDEQKSNEFLKMAQRKEVISNTYIQDLYRFFHLYPSKHEFENIFKREIELYKIDILKPIFNGHELLDKVAEFYLKKEKYVQALGIYQLLLEKNKANANLYQKAGYCLQKEMQLEEAIEMYMKADIIQPDNLWTIRRIAACHRLLHHYSTALQYYRKAEKKQPNNVNVLLSIATCLIETEAIQEALQYFYRMDLMQEGNMKIWRGITWCSLLLNKYEQAESYTQKILNKGGNVSDYINGGHISLISRDMGIALERYKKAFEIIKESQQFRDAVLKDKELLIQRGVQFNELNLLLDAVFTDEQH